MSAWTRRRPRFVVLAGVAVATIALAGCSGSDTPPQTTPSHSVGSSPETTPATTPEAVLPATLTSSVKSAATGVAVDTPITVTAANGTLKSVVFRDADGKRLLGSFNKAHTTWTASE